MNSTHLPPLPKEEESGPQVCNTVRLYLAVLDDLSPEQVTLLFKHVETCSTCSEEFQLMNGATHLVGGLDASSPSRRVDTAIMALQFDQNGMRTRKPVMLAPLRGRSIKIISQAVVAIAAILLFMFLTATHFIAFAPSRANAFELPANLSWSNYVLYHSETRTGANGMVYHVESYHDLGTNNMHVETMADEQVDVVVVVGVHPSDSNHRQVEPQQHRKIWKRTETRRSVDRGQDAADVRDCFRSRWCAHSANEATAPKFITYDR